MSDESKGPGITNLLEGLLRALEHKKFPMLAAIIVVSGAIFILLPAQHRNIIAGVMIFFGVAFGVSAASRIYHTVSKQR
jgi:Na+/H+ antiporter NhaA